MGTNTGIGIGIGIPFKNNALGGDRPYLPPELKARLIGVWDNYGKKNTDADRNIIKNKIPNAGGDLEILNAAYKLNSGFGEYKEDFTDWRIYPNIKVTDSVVTTDGNFKSSWFIYKHSSESKINEMNIKVSGIPKGGKILYFYISDETANLPILYTIPKDGIYHLPESKINNNRASVGFTVESSYDWNNIRIEQIPSFEGAFVTDGIDDLITSTKTVQEMLGGSNELTIVSMVHQVKDSANNVSFTNYIRGSANGYFRNIVNNYDKTGIYGYTSSDLKGLSVVNNILGDKNDYTSNGDNRDSIINGNFSVQGYSYNDGNNTGDFSSVAWYWTIIANKVLTTDQINQVIAYFNLDRTLKPDILCDVKKQGITNENHAEFGDRLIDFSGNGRDIQLNNIAWDGDSGIGKYNYPNWKVNVTQGNKYARIVYYDSINGTYSANFKGITDLYKSYGLSIEIRVNRANTVDFHSIKEDGIYTMTPPDDTTSIDIRFGGENVYNASCDITITQIPSHAGALCLDGVNDFGKVTGMPIYKDYTVIADYERFYLEPITGGRASILSKSSKVGDGSFIFNLENQDGSKACYTFGEANGNISDDITRIIRYQSKYYNTKTLSIGTAEDNDFMVLGKVREVDSRYFYGAIYSLMSFPYSMSEFLIDRQLKKHKLGTLYPDMVEFRPVINSNIDIKKINYWDKDWNILHIGDYVSIGNDIKTNITVPNGYKISKVTSNAFDNITIEKSSTEFIYDVKFYGIKKSPQKINLTIEQDENYVLFNPVINSNYDNYKLTFHLREYEKLINIGDYIPKDTYIRANLYLKNNIDELVTFTFNGVNIDYVKSSVSDLAYNIIQIYNYDSPQEVNITIDEYIRYEEIVQPYPVIFQITDRNTNQRYSWGDKIKVGSSIRLSQGEKPNLLSGLYSIQSYEYEGETYSYNQLTNLNIILTKQSISLSCNKTWLLDDNEPKCILSPRLLRIPNSSYKILGYIPDISGHGNHGVIHNSAYAEGSGVNEDGSYQFDGVDDFITIPTTVGGKQVLMKVNWQSIAGTAILYDQRTNGGFAIFNRDFDTNENKVPAYRARNIGGSTYIDGILNEYIYASELKDITHNIVELCDPELNTGTLNPKIGSSFLNSNYTQMSLYDFMLFDEISTDDKILELNTYIGITPKVTLPNYYWDNYGKKNTDANRGHVDEQVSLQKTGTSVNPLENFNISYEGMSGYNGYPVVFGASKTWETLSGAYGYISNVTNTTIHVTHAEHAGNGLLFNYVKKDGALANIKEIPAFRVTVRGLEGNSKFAYRYLATEDAKEETLVYLGNGTHELAKSFAPTEALLDLTNNAWVGILITPMIEGEVVFDCDITIEVLPEYENGLAYDGVSDFSQNTEIEVVEDFTFLVKGSLLKGLTGSGGCIARKGDKKHYDTGGYAFIYCFDSPIESYRNSYYSFGKSFVPSKEIVAPPLIGYMTKTNVNGETTTFGTNSDIKGIIFGNWSSGYMNMVIYKSIFYTKTISLLEINFLKNLMEKDEIIDINHPIFISNTEDESNTSQDT